MTTLLSLITPTNFAQEQEKFLASTRYNPTFHYIWQDQTIDPKFSVSDKQSLWEAIKNQDHTTVSAVAARFFEVDYDDAKIQAATHVASEKKPKCHGTAEEYVQLLRECLNYFGLSEVEVVLTDDGGFNARPHLEKKRLLVSKHIQFEYFSMVGGVHHELVHCLRYYNRKYNKIHQSHRYLPTEEGLASWCQDNTNDDNGAAQHAMEYVASSVGLKGSLRDIYDFLCDLGMSRELAWKRASRHKFGFVDTSLPGDILKPAMYYANEIKVAKLTTDEKLRLFVGKIATDELPAHPTYTGLWPAEEIISYFKL